jgi:hypothetical protein
MNRRTILMLIGILGLAVSRQVGFAQSNSWIGTWKLNLAKSTFSPGAPPRSQTSTVEAVGQGIKITNDGVDAQGNPAKNVIQLFNDGQSHPVGGGESVLGTLIYDAYSDKEVNSSTWWDIRTKAGKVVQVVVNEMAPDGKSWTLKIMGVTPSGQQVYNVLVRDKQ